MSDNEKQASVKSRTNQFRQLLQSAGLYSGSGSPFENMYVNIGGSQLRTICNYNSNLVTYCTYEDSFFDEVDGEGHGIVYPDMIQGALNIVGGDGFVDFELWGNPDDELAPQGRLNGELSSTFALASGQNRFSNVPTGLIDRFSDNGNFRKKDGEELSTRIETNVEQLERIINATEFQSDSQDENSYFDLVVEDGDWILNVGEEYNRQITGSLTSEVEGEDLSNKYGELFQDLVSPVSGDVTIFVEDDMPLILVQKTDDFMFRGMLTPKV